MLLLLLLLMLWGANNVYRSVAKTVRHFGCCNLSRDCQSHTSNPLDAVTTELESASIHILNREVSAEPLAPDNRSGTAHEGHWQQQRQQQQRSHQTRLARGYRCWCGAFPLAKLVELSCW